MVSPRGVDVGRVLRAAAAGSPVEAVESVATELGAVFDAMHVSLLIADLSGRAVVRLLRVPRTSEPPGRAVRSEHEVSATVLPFDGGPVEQTIRTQTPHVSPPDATEEDARGWWRVLAPVTERGEAIGVLELYLEAEPAPETVAEIRQVAHLLAFIVIANRRHTDLFEWGQRTRPFHLSAEIQQRLLPGPRTCEANAFTLAGWLEPAADIGGDTFDFSQDRDVLHLSLTDAMGHGVDAALTASLCLGSLRGSRQGGATLLEQAHATNRAVAEHASSRSGDDFATGLLGRVDLHSGECAIVNCGHVAPFLVHGNDVRALELPADLPLGMFPDTSYRATRVTLIAGDRLVWVTDGMLERNVAGIDLPGVLAATRDLHPRELVRVLADSALSAAGHRLSDDATILCLDWHGDHDLTRATVAGADPVLATAPLI